MVPPPQGSVNTINFPANAIIDLASIRWIIENATATQSGSTTGTYYAKLPDAHDLISRVDV